MQETAWAAGVPPQTPLGELTELPDTLVVPPQTPLGELTELPDTLADGGGWLHLPKNSTPLSAFQASPVPTPYFSNRHQTKILATALDHHECSSSKLCAAAPVVASSSLGEVQGWLG